MDPSSAERPGSVISMSSETARPGENPPAAIERADLATRPFGLYGFPGYKQTASLARGYQAEVYAVPLASGGWIAMMVTGYSSAPDLDEHGFVPLDGAAAVHPTAGEALAAGRAAFGIPDRQWDEPRPQDHPASTEAA